MAATPDKGILLHDISSNLREVPQIINIGTPTQDVGQKSPPGDLEMAGNLGKEGEETRTAEHQYPSGYQFCIIVTVLSLVTFLIMLDSTIIATAIPYISDEFHSLEDIAWYSSVYTMVSSVSQLLFGKLLVRYSARLIYSSSMFLFLAGSAVCGSAPNSPALIAGRAIAGVGCAGLLVSAFSLVPVIAPPAMRPVVLGLTSAARGLATTFGPLIGGALTEKVSWRWTFYINLPIGAVIQLAFFLYVHPPKKDSDTFTSWTDFVQTLDPFGFLFLLPSVVSLLLALQWGGLRYTWQDGRIIALLVLFIVLGIAFIGTEVWQGAKAVLPARVFTQRTVSAASFYGFCSTGAIFVLTYYLPIWFQGVKGASPIQSGVWTLPWVITSTITSLVAGILIAKIRHADMFLIGGAAIGAIGSGLFTTLTLETSTAKWIGYQIIFALSSSLSNLIPLMIAQEALSLKDVPIGSAMIMFTQTIGASIFVAVSQALFTNSLAKGLKSTGIASNVAEVASGGITTLTKSLTGNAKRMVLIVINDALVQSWRLALVLSCISILGALAVEHLKLWGRQKA